VLATRKIVLFRFLDQLIYYNVFILLGNYYLHQCYIRNVSVLNERVREYQPAGELMQLGARLRGPVVHLDLEKVSFVRCSHRSLSCPFISHSSFTNVSLSPFIITWVAVGLWNHIIAFCMCLFAAHAEFFFTKSMIRFIVTRICLNILHCCWKRPDNKARSIYVTLQGFMSFQLIVFCRAVKTVVTPVVRAELPLSSFFFFQVIRLFFTKHRNRR